MSGRKNNSNLKAITEKETKSQFGPVRQVPGLNSPGSLWLRKQPTLWSGGLKALLTHTEYIFIPRSANLFLETSFITS